MHQRYFRKAAVVLTSLVWLAFSPAAWAAPVCQPADVLPDNLFPAVKIETSKGDFVIELNRMRAPITASNFLQYVLDGHYDGTVFHRVMPGFVVQGGGYTEAFEEKPTRDPVFNESGNGLQNLPMTVAMARFDDPHTATSQFFVNLAANASLDPGARNWGYTVFGAVISGQEVIEAIASSATEYNAALDASDVPVNTILIKRATVVDAP